VPPHKEHKKLKAALNTLWI